MVVAPADTLFALDLWHGADHAAASAALGFALPDAGQGVAVAGGTVLRVGPRRWWLNGAGFADLTPGDQGVVTPVGGGWTRVTLNGAGWRDLIMQSGLIDAESAQFGSGSVAVTPLHHARCAVFVRANDICEVFVPNSYSGHILSHWDHLGWTRVTGANPS
ncbi:sarcosine oxidase subunit gamma family protein [Novosphingobium sp.]|uniref:sarcosine oxidase subunit gamma family protein n=1 Tax=Novosphingobium sp. TaxID=1874826 RepID=UPI0033417236